jgi:hypothetical protein
MAKFSQKQGGKEVGQAAVYAAPHTMKGEKISVESQVKAQYEGKDPNTLAAKDMNPRVHGTYRVSAGDPAADNTKTTGIKIRGTGAATKGLMARGPMA